MYKHQILEQMEKDLKYYESKKLLTEEEQGEVDIVRLMRRLMLDAQCFYLGEASDFLDATAAQSSRSSDVIFSKETAYRLPYEVCLLESLVFDEHEDCKVKTALIVVGYEQKEDEKYIKRYHFKNFTEFGYEVRIYAWFCDPRDRTWKPAGFVLILFVDLTQQENCKCSLGSLFSRLSNEELDAVFRGEEATMVMRIVNSFNMLMTCQNIVKEENIPPAKLQKKRVKSGKLPLFSYYTLKLRPTSSKQAYESKNLWSNRIHLCRGHIKRYTKEKPLFGRVVGNIWCPPHARGDKNLGVIQKDYSV